MALAMAPLPDRDEEAPEGPGPADRTVALLVALVPLGLPALLLLLSY